MYYNDLCSYFGSACAYLCILTSETTKLKCFKGVERFLADDDVDDDIVFFDHVMSPGNESSDEKQSERQHGGCCNGG